MLALNTYWANQNVSYTLNDMTKDSTRRYPLLLLNRIGFDPEELSNLILDFPPNQHEPLRRTSFGGVFLRLWQQFGLGVISRSQFLKNISQLMSIGKTLLFWWRRRQRFKRSSDFSTSSSAQLWKDSLTETYIIGSYAISGFPPKTVTTLTIWKDPLPNQNINASWTSIEYLFNYLARCIYHLQGLKSRLRPQPPSIDFYERFPLHSQQPAEDSEFKSQSSQISRSRCLDGTFMCLPKMARKKVPNVGPKARNFGVRKPNCSWEMIFTKETCELIGR